MAVLRFLGNWVGVLPLACPVGDLVRLLIGPVCCMRLCTKGSNIWQQISEYMSSGLKLRDIN
jgi:hypothetical protein